MSGAALDGALGKAAAAATTTTARPRRKLLSAEEAELFELAQAAGSGLDPEVFKVLLDLLRMNVAPLAVFQMLKSMCAGQRLPAGAEGGPAAAPAPLPADTREAPTDSKIPAPLAFASALRPPRLGGAKLVVCSPADGRPPLSQGRNKTSSAASGTQVLAERSSREGSAQRMPRQPSASRLQKVGASGKNSGGNST
ncbi:mitotic-spindle organizing protein 2B-like isoform X1 [Dromaius novaehollandiae]|uniref:mitotic-spindle organizing protein 2B-like isoform X1 n=1 Tax=Dromaius novaehollandiae TaxID=8790 RepID=UPI00311E8A29